MGRQMYTLCVDRKKAATNGFSLIELLIVVAIILIIAAIAIPNMIRAKISANEASAATSVRNISRAEVTYNAAYPVNGYASSLAELGGPADSCQPSATAACLISSDLSGGQKSGYQFQVTALLPAGGMNTAFVVGAVPLTFNSTGVRDFCATNDGVVRAQTGQSGDTPTTDLSTCAAYEPIQ
jgi:type IV pilus assembly protein PilA